LVQTANNTGRSDGVGTIRPRKIVAIRSTEDSFDLPALIVRSYLILMKNGLASSSTEAVDIAPTKSHYVILDGLRGVAAIMVVLMHTFEVYDDGDTLKLMINHAYLAVDFFFLLSGFVIAYAYDDRWDRMSIGGFFKRRLIRLQPMVIMGSLIGGALFYFQGGSTFPLVNATPVWKLLIIMLIGCTLIPIPTSMDIRGWQEMHPLDGPAWSLFYEYVANILYATVLRRLSRALLVLLTVLAAALLVQVAVFRPEGDLVGGWSITAAQLHIGFARLLFPFLAGMLIKRLDIRIRVPHAFVLCSLLLVAAFSLPRLGGPDHRWVNGLYEASCIIILFPLIIAIGAGEQRVEGRSIRVARFFGDLSYPLYISHYPLIYIFTARVAQDKIPLARGSMWAALLITVAIANAYACLKLYDEPVRKWLSQRFLPGPPLSKTLSGKL
jgi:peptidoglycan/LPS O-acetylase OafA/YrhL